jgi:hypothetical protein
MIKNKLVSTRIKLVRNLFFSPSLFLLDYCHFGIIPQNVYISLFEEYTVIGDCGVEQ